MNALDYDLENSSGEVGIYQAPASKAVSSRPRGPLFKKYPRSVYYIFGNEVCERFSYYGLRAVLFLYMHEYLLFSEDSSTALFHTFVFTCYGFSLLGGILSDGYLGKYKTILYLSMIYCIGSTILSLTAIPGATGNPPHWWGMALGLLLIAIGTGGIKPCVSSFGGDQFRSDQHDMLESFFAFFYFTINLGSVVSMFLTPVIRSEVGYWLAFGVPAVLLFVATLVFYSGRNDYRKVPVGTNVILLFFNVVKIALWKSISNWRVGAMTVNTDPTHKPHWLDRAEPFYGKKAVEEVKSVLHILSIFVPLPIFWALYDQHSSRWIAQGLKMDRHIVGSLYIAPDQMPALNPFFLLFLIPLFDRVIFPSLYKRGVELRPLKRMILGMLLTAISFVIAAILQFAIEANDKVSIGWQLIQYFVLSIGEILVSISGLEFSYSQAPQEMRSVVMACWLLTTAAGNLLVAFIAELNLFSQAVEFIFFAILMVLFMLIFIVIARRYTYRSSLVVLPEDHDDSFIMDQYKQEEQDEYLSHAASQDDLLSSDSPSHSSQI